MPLEVIWTQYWIFLMVHFFSVIFLVRLVSWSAESKAHILALPIDAVSFRAYPSSEIEHSQREATLLPVLVNFLLL